MNIANTSTIKDLSPQAQQEFNQLSSLIKFAKKNKWYDLLAREYDVCQVIMATLEDVGATHVHLVKQEVRLSWSVGTSTRNSVSGFEIRDGAIKVFVGPRGQEDREKSIAQSVRRLNSKAEFESLSTWIDEADDEGVLSLPSVRKHPLGQNLLSQCSAHFLEAGLIGQEASPRASARPRL